MGLPGEAKIPVLTIVLEAGFRSISTFNKAFKMRNLLSLLFCTASLFLLAGCEREAPQPDSAAMAAASGAYRTCAACHGATGLGNRALQAPSLVNLDEDYLRRQVVNFRDGVRGRHPKDQWGQQMSDQAALLRDEASVEAVVLQIARFENEAPAPTFEADLEKGKDLYGATCGSCHGPDASGNALLNAPSLRGIDDWYLVRQYENFRDGIRGAHEEDKFGQQMLLMGQVLKSDDDIEAVSAWIASLGIDE